MPLATCPFCESKMPLNWCGCRFARRAMLSNLARAREEYEADVARQPKPAVEPDRVSPPAEPTIADAVVAGPAEASAEQLPSPPKVKRARRVKPPPAPVVVEPLDGARRPLLAPKGNCGFCDRRRESDNARIKRHRAKKAKEAAAE